MCEILCVCMFIQNVSLVNKGAFLTLENLSLLLRVFTTFHGNIETSLSFLK